MLSENRSAYDFLLVSGILTQKNDKLNTPDTTSASRWQVQFYVYISSVNSIFIELDGVLDEEVLPLLFGDFIFEGVQMGNVTFSSWKSRSHNSSSSGPEKTHLLEQLQNFSESPCLHYGIRSGTHFLPVERYPASQDINNLPLQEPLLGQSLQIIFLSNR